MPPTFSTLLLFVLGDSIGLAADVPAVSSPLAVFSYYYRLLDQ